MLVETGSAQGGIEHDEKEMIHGVIELAETKVHEVMVPRIGIRAVDVNDPIDEVLDLIVRAGHSRVCRSTGRTWTTSSASCTPRTCCRT